MPALMEDSLGGVLGGVPDPQGRRSVEKEMATGATIRDLEEHLVALGLDVRSGAIITTLNGFGLDSGRQSGVSARRMRWQFSTTSTAGRVQPANSTYIDRANQRHRLSSLPQW